MNIDLKKYRKLDLHERVRRSDRDKYGSSPDIYDQNWLQKHCSEQYFRLRSKPCGSKTPKNYTQRNGHALKREKSMQIKPVKAWGVIRSGKINSTCRFGSVARRDWIPVLITPIQQKRSKK